MVIKCPYCGCYIEPVLELDETYDHIIVVCPACGMNLTGKDLEGGEEDGDD